MNLYLRLILVLLRHLRCDRLHFSSRTEHGFRVLPHDIDAFGHMNNGRYLQIMDVARTAWMIRTGVAAAIRRNRWAPVLGGGVIRYRHSLKLMQRYRVRTRLLGWDERWFYHEHAFIDASERYVAVGVTRAALRGGGRWVRTERVAAQVAPGAMSPPVPRHVRHWIDLEEEMFRFGSEDRAASPAAFLRSDR